MKQPTVQMRLNLRQAALLELLFEFAEKNRLYDRCFQNSALERTNVLASKVKQRVVKAKARLLAKKTDGSCTGCGASPYHVHKANSQ